MDEDTNQRLNTIQSWLSPQPPKRKAASQLYLVEVAAQEKEIIESGLRECQGRVFGPSGVAAKLGGRLVRAGIEDTVAENRQESLQAPSGNLRAPVSHKLLLN